ANAFNLGSGNQLYISSASSPNVGINTVGTGMPTTSGQTASLIPLAGGQSFSSPYDFFFANSSTLYVADDGNTNDCGGLQKWTLSGGTWSKAFSLLSIKTSGADLTGTNRTGLRQMTGVVSGSTVTIYATSNENSANRLVKFIDTVSNVLIGGVSETYLA